MYKKNDIVTIKITDQGATGEGIGKAEGYTFFVKDTIIGDLVQVKVIKAKKSYGYARLMKVIEPSQYRVEPPCPIARSCGGCQLQAMQYAQQLKFKQEKVYNNIKRIAGITDFVMNSIIGMEEPFYYRNKAQFPIGKNKEGKIISGFYAGRTHSIIETDTCMLGMWKNNKDINREILQVVKKFMETYGIEPYDEISHEGLVRHILIRLGAQTGQIMVCIVINGKKLPKAENLIEQLLKISGMKDISLNVNTEKSNVILGNRVISLYGNGYIEDYIGDIKFRISPLSFFQVNPKQTRRLYEKALEYANLTGKETVWDLYCGTGTISLFLAKKAKKVLGVEIVPEAIADAKKNAAMNDIENAEFMTGAAEKVVPEYFARYPQRPECRPDVLLWTHREKAVMKFY